MSKSRSYFQNVFSRNNNSKKKLNNKPQEPENPLDVLQKEYLDDLAAKASDGGSQGNKSVKKYLDNCEKLSVEGVRKFYVTLTTEGQKTVDQLGEKFVGDPQFTSRRSFLHDKATNAAAEEIIKIVNALQPLVLLEIFKLEVISKFRSSFAVMTEENLKLETNKKLEVKPDEELGVKTDEESKVDQTGSIFKIITNRTKTGVVFKLPNDGLFVIEAIGDKLMQDLNTLKEKDKKVLYSFNKLKEEFEKHENGRGYEKTFREKIGISSIKSIFYLRPIHGLFGLKKDLFNLRQNRKDHIETGNEHKSHYVRHFYKEFTPNGKLKNVIRVNEFKDKLTNFEELLKEDSGSSFSKKMFDIVSTIRERLNKFNNVDEKSKNNEKSIKDLLQDIELEVGLNRSNTTLELEEKINALLIEANENLIDNSQIKKDPIEFEYNTKKSNPEVECVLLPKDKELMVRDITTQTQEKLHKPTLINNELSNNLDLFPDIAILSEKESEKEYDLSPEGKELQRLQDEKKLAEKKLVSNLNSSWEKYKEHKVKASDWKNGKKVSWDRTVYPAKPRVLEVAGFLDLEDSMNKLGDVQSNGKTLKESYVEIFDDLCKKCKTEIKYQKTVNKIREFSNEIATKLQKNPYGFTEEAAQSYVTAYKNFALAGVNISPVEQKNEIGSRS